MVVYQQTHSLRLVVVSAHRLGCDDAGVRAGLLLRLAECVLVRGHEQSLVVGAANQNVNTSSAVVREAGRLDRDLPSVAEDDLGRVLVGHYDGGAGQARSVSQGVVGLKGLVDHTGVEVGSHLEDVAKQLT